MLYRKIAEVLVMSVESLKDACESKMSSHRESKRRPDPPDNWEKGIAATENTKLKQVRQQAPRKSLPTRLSKMRG